MQVVEIKENHYSRVLRINALHSMAVLPECTAHFPPLRLHHPLQPLSNYCDDVVKLLEHYLAAHLNKMYQLY